MTEAAASTLNWREIDLVLEELTLSGGLVQEVHQPAHDRFVLGLFRSGEPLSVLACLSQRFPRIHILTEKLQNPARPFRFAAFLRAHIKGGRIESAAQEGRERLVRISVSKAGEQSVLWLRLWGSAANAILTDGEGRILDAFYRRPKRGEVSGGRFPPPEAAGERRGPAGAARPSVPARPSAPARPRAEKEYTIRELPGEGSFNQRIERLFRELETRGDSERRLAEMDTGLAVSESKVLANIEKLEKRLADYRNLERFRQLGDLLTSSLHRVVRGERWVRVEDFFNDNAPLDIELKTELTPAQNAEAYYERYRKARDGLGKVTEEIEHLRGMLARIQKQRRGITEDPEAALREGERRRSERARTAIPEGAPGLAFESPPFRIIVGRSAAENDELLRRFVRGNDWWFHARDFPGAYVFVKAPPGKSLPLETMLDAGNLAVHFSKGKSSGGGDVYYTRVKYLRRVKGGKRGLVIPTQEKNLSIRLDPARLERLKGGDALP
jgi:predicted ribosome quality control (RQC) complex YloA/Tae2 family protein